jgi:predicted CoA-binding protein
VNKLRKFGNDVVAIGRKKTKVADVNIDTEKKEFENVDTVTLYLKPENQKEYYDYILSLHPKRIIFNPGAENQELFDIANSNNIKPLEACTLVLLGTNQF